MLVKLTHVSAAVGCEGKPGDIVDAPDYLAELWLRTRGAVPVPEDELPPPAPKAKPKATKKEVTDDG